MSTNSIHPEDKVEIDYSAYDLRTQKLKPTVYRLGDSFGCLSGPDPETGIFGRGDSPDAAVKAWRNALQERLNRLHDSKSTD